LKYFYVICPVSADPDFADKRAMLQELGTETGVAPFFPLERHSQFYIEAVSRDMKLAAFVVADLSFERPSCYFELGVAEAVGATVFLVATTGTPIHQVGEPREIAWYEDTAGYRSIISGMIASYSDVATGPLIGYHHKR